MIEFLLFGGWYQSFDKSFCQISINFDTFLENKNKTCNNTNINDDFIKIEYNPPQWIKNISVKNIKNVTDKYKQELYLEQKFMSFSYHWLYSRYLIIIGGEIPAHMFQTPMISNLIFCFDSQTTQWKILKDKLPKGIAGHCCVLCPKSKQKMYILGGNYVNLYDEEVTNNIMYQWKFDNSIEWEMERVVWIGVLKNSITNEDRDNTADKLCFLCVLPKDIVQYLLVFLKNDHIF